MVSNQDDFVNDIQDDVYIPLQMDNLDIQELYQLEYVRDDVPNILPKRNQILRSFSYDWNSIYTLTLDTYEHCRHRWTFALFDGVDFSLFVLPFINSVGFIEFVIGIGTGIGSSSVGEDFWDVWVRLCSSRIMDESQ